MVIHKMGYLALNLRVSWPQVPESLIGKEVTGIRFCPLFSGFPMKGGKAS
jgi:hypothetical protein